MEAASSTEIPLVPLAEEAIFTQVVRDQLGEERVGLLTQDYSRSPKYSKIVEPGPERSKAKNVIETWQAYKVSDEKGINVGLGRRLARYDGAGELTSLDMATWESAGSRQRITVSLQGSSYRTEVNSYTPAGMIPDLDDTHGAHDQDRMVRERIVLLNNEVVVKDRKEA